MATARFLLYFSFIFWLESKASTIRMRHSSTIMRCVSRRKIWRNTATGSCWTTWRMWRSRRASWNSTRPPSRYQSELELRRIIKGFSNVWSINQSINQSHVLCLCFWSINQSINHTEYVCFWSINQSITRAMSMFLINQSINHTCHVYVSDQSINQSHVPCLCFWSINQSITSSRSMFWSFVYRGCVCVFFPLFVGIYLQGLADGHIQDMTTKLSSGFGF